MKPKLEAVNKENYTTLSIWVENKFSKKLIQEIKNYALNHHLAHLLLVSPEVIIYLTNTRDQEGQWQEHQLSTTGMLFKIGFLPRKNIDELTTQIVSLMYFIKATSSFQNSPDEVLFDLYAHMFGETELYSIV